MAHTVRLFLKKKLRGHLFNWKLLRISPTHIFKNRDPHFDLRRFDAWKRFQKQSPNPWFDGDESHGIPIRQKKSPTKQIHVPFQSWFVVGKTHLEVMFLFANAQNVLEKNKNNRRNQPTTTLSQNAGGKRPWNAFWITNGMFTSSSLPTYKRADFAAGFPRRSLQLYRGYYVAKTNTMHNYKQSSSTLPLNVHCFFSRKCEIYIMTPAFLQGWYRHMSGRMNISPT